MLRSIEWWSLLALLVVASSPEVAHCNVTNQWVELATGTYSVHTKPMVWSKSWKLCKEYGGHLLTLETIQEREAVKNFIATAAPGVELHVGIHDLFHEGVYLTTYGYPLSTTIFQWAVNEPNNAPTVDEDCTAADSNMLLHDVLCTAGGERGFICEKCNYCLT